SFIGCSVDLHSFPRRRPSDLLAAEPAVEHADAGARELGAGGEALGGLDDAAGGVEGGGLLLAVLVEDGLRGSVVGLVLVDPGAESGRAHVWTPVTCKSRMPSS